MPIEPYSVEIGVTITQKFDKLSNEHASAEGAVLLTGKLYRENLAIRLEKKGSEAPISSRLLSTKGKFVNVIDRKNATAVVARIEGLSDLPLSELEGIVLKTMPETKNASIVIELTSKDVETNKRRTYSLNENTVDIVYKQPEK